MNEISRRVQLIARKFRCWLTLSVSLIAVAGCTDKQELEDRVDSLSARVAALEESVAAINSNSIALRKIFDSEILIVGKTEITEVGTVTGYILEFSDGSTVNVTFGDKVAVSAPIIGVDADGNWIMSLDGGKTFSIIDNADGAVNEGPTPLLKVDDSGYWMISVDGGETYSQILNSYGKPISAVDGASVAGSFFTDVRYDESSGKMIFVLKTGETVEADVLDTFFVKVAKEDASTVITLDETQLYEVESGEVADVTLIVPEGWAATYTDKEFSVTGPSSGVAGDYIVRILAVSTKGYIRSFDLEFTLNPVTLSEGTKAWQDFVADNSSNVLLDWSYAGYNHGESAPPDVMSLGYTVYDVTDYGAVADDGKSDREAFLATVKAALGGKDYTVDGSNNISFPHTPSAGAIIYFPEGEYILHDENDDVDGKSQSILIRAGQFVIKGAGRDKTRIVMASPNLPTSESVLYSSPDMIQLKHNSTYSSYTTPATVTAAASKGSFSVEVASVSGISTGDFVCLHVKNADADFVASELSPYTAQSSWDISENGVEVIDYHQVKSVSGTTVTFVEPLMHEVVVDKGWEVMKYPNYTGVGVEDLTFVGNAKEKFQHHGSWQDDGAYKPLSMSRLTNSWIRRVGFESVSESCSIINSANISAYDIIFSGNRGHASLRSQASSRVLIADTEDRTSGYLAANGGTVTDTYCEKAGNYHAVGVSKHSIGTVLWRNIWGDDSCFESHASQPRATLIDCCSGGWMRWRQGGDASQMPNHLSDLAVWNFYATSDNKAASDGSIDSNFLWWDTSSQWWKFLPPVIVGFSGAVDITFNADQTKLDESHGTPVWPESLYEAQLRKRLGYVPAWLNALK